MIKLKVNPVGIDLVIQDIQQKLYDKLGYTNIDAYGRSYLIKQDKKTVLTSYDNNGEYKEIVLKKSNAVYFFVDNEKSKIINSIEMETEVDLIFFLDLKKIKPNITHRADEEVRMEIKQVLDKISTFNLTEITKGEKALADFDSNLIDVQPYHFIRFSGNVKYSNNNC